MRKRSLEQAVAVVPCSPTCEIRAIHKQQSLLSSMCATGMPELRLQTAQGRQSTVCDRGPSLYFSRGETVGFVMNIAVPSLLCSQMPLWTTGS